MGYTTIDVGNIFNSLFRIYKTTKLLMQYNIYLHMDLVEQSRKQKPQYML